MRLSKRPSIRPMNLPDSASVQEVVNTFKQHYLAGTCVYNTRRPHRPLFSPFTQRPQTLLTPWTPPECPPWPPPTAPGSLLYSSRPCKFRVPILRCTDQTSDPSLYGIGILQTFLYFQWSSKDSWSIKTPVSTSPHDVFVCATYSIEPGPRRPVRAPSACQIKATLTQLPPAS